MLVLGGWLGSGKTTLVNRLLAEAPGGERIVVFVNDIGEIDVDAGLIAARSGDTVELTNGCACCAIGDSLGAALRDQVLGPHPPDRIVIEASGVAEPDRVAAYGDRRRVRLDGIVVCVDATDVVRRSGNRLTGRLVRRQVAAADLLVLTKGDLLEDGGAAARAWCGGVSSAPVVVASDCGAWVALLFGGLGELGGLGGLGGLETAGVAPDEPIDFPVETALWEPSHAVTAEAVAAALAEVVASEPALLRAKGVFSDGVVQMAAGRIDIDPVPDGFESTTTANCLVLIAAPGWDRDRALARLAVLDRRVASS